MSLLKSPLLIWLSAIFYFLTETGDVVSTYLPMPTGFEESNPYARDASHNPVFWHIVGLKALLTLCIVILALIVYYGTRSLSPIVAQMGAAAPFLWYGFDVLDAIVHNVLVWRGWYSP